MNRLGDYAIGYQGAITEDECAECGSTLEQVRPGKWQCQKCELDSILQQARREALGRG